GGDVEALVGEPGGVAVGAAVAVAAVADEGDDAAALAARPHLLDQFHAGGDVGAGGAAHVAAGDLAHPVHGGDRAGVGHRDHAVDHGRQERRLDAGPADALDARARRGDLEVAGHPAGVEGGALHVGHGQAGGVLAVADVAADGRAGAAGAGADHYPGGFGVRFQAHLVEDRFGDVVVAPPVGGALGVGELVHEVAA